jgi:hypothetical protein
MLLFSGHTGNLIVFYMTDIKTIFTNPIRAVLNYSHSKSYEHLENGIADKNKKKVALFVGNIWSKIIFTNYVSDMIS